MTHRRDHVVGAGLMVAAMALFAVMAVATRQATRTMAAPQLVFLRFGLMCSGVVALALSGRAQVAPRNLRLLVLRGLFGGAAVLLYFVALERCRDAGTATLLNFTSPLFTSLFAWAFLSERPTLRLWLGMAVATCGVLLVLRTPQGFVLGPGEVAGMCSAVLSGIAVTTIRAARAYDNAPTILLAFSAGGLLISLPFALPVWSAASPPVWALAVVVGVTSFGAQLMMTHAFGLVTAGEGALFQQLTPIFTFGLGALLLGEKIGAQGLVGTLLTLLAVVYAGWPARPLRPGS